MNKIHLQTGLLMINYLTLSIQKIYKKAKKPLFNE